MERKFRSTTCLFEEFFDLLLDLCFLFPFLRLRKYRIELQP